MTEHTVRLPYRDVERREVLRLMLGFTKQMSRRMTCEEMEIIGISRGLLSRGETKK